MSSRCRNGANMPIAFAPFHFFRTLLVKDADRLNFFKINWNKMMRNCGGLPHTGIKEDFVGINEVYRLYGERLCNG